MQEKKAIELLKEAWVLLDIVEPNNPVTDKLWKFLTDIGDETEMEKLLAYLKTEEDRAHREGNAAFRKGNRPYMSWHRGEAAAYEYVAEYITTQFREEEGDELGMD